MNFNRRELFGLIAATGAASVLPAAVRAKSVQAAPRAAEIGEAQLLNPDLWGQHLRDEMLRSLPPSASRP